MRVRSPRDFWAGLALLALAAIAAVQAIDLDFGRTARMGPGYFPMVLSGLIALFGVVLVTMGLRIDGASVEPWRPRRLVPVLAAIALFGLTIRALGLIPSGAALIIISALAAPDFRWRGTLLFGGALLVFAAVLFTELLGLPLPVWPRL